MPEKKFKCSKCDRSFSMAAHLARHMGTLHASPKARAAKAATAKVKKRRTTRGRSAKRVGRPTGLVSRLGLRDMTLEQLQNLIAAAREQGQRKLGELRAAFG